MIQHFINILRPIAENLEPISNSFRVAAMVVYKNKIISIGFNQSKSHPFQAKYGKNRHAIYWHAETNAIFYAKKILNKKQLKKSTIIICRVRKDSYGKLRYGISAPCSGCQRCIRAHGIKKIVYTINSNYNEMAYHTVIINS